MSQSPQQKPIFAYGFDAAGIGIPSDTLRLENGRELTYIAYRADAKLAEASGVIVPSGIFETEQNISGYGARRWFESDEHHLASREKEVFQLLERGGWVTFLIGKIENGPGGEW